MKVSILLIGYNSWHFLQNNLKSLSFIEKRRDVEVIYIDNGSVDGTVANLKKMFPFVKVTVNKTNRGVAAARNQGFRRAVGEYIWILDSDTQVTEKSFKEMLAFMEKHPEVGLCGCKMFGDNGVVQDSCRKFPSIKAKFKAGINILLKKLGIYDPYAPKSHDYDKNQEEPFEVDYVIGACQFIRSTAQKKVGFLDENIFYGPEDADFCLRMKKARYKIYYLPHVPIYHAYQRVSTYHLFSKMNLKHIQGLIYYFRKHSKKNSHQ
ncbi:MAG: glycosyltransferase family 2 protein [Bacteroidales bacterium]|nr:glycosyltransferase family 2 protein [Bacteroidales bacterium]